MISAFQQCPVGISACCEHLLGIQIKDVKRHLMFDVCSNPTLLDSENDSDENMLLEVNSIRSQIGDQFSGAENDCAHDVDGDVMSKNEFSGIDVEFFCTKLNFDPPQHLHQLKACLKWQT
jgi:hypothetical protein